MNKKNIEHNPAAENEVILHQALDALKKLVPLEYEVEPDPNLREQGYDCAVRAQVFGLQIVWRVQVRNRFTRAVEFLALIDNDKAQSPFLTATRYVSPEAAARLHARGVQFIDTAGNAFINQPPLFIFVTGNRPKTAETAVPAVRLFKGVGLKIAYLLLCRPDLVGRPYRELAEMAHVALGTVNSTMMDMIRKGFIVDMGKRGKMLQERKSLLERWVMAYPDVLKPKILLGRFRGDGNWWDNTRLDPIVAQWGGEVAAAKLTGYLKPGTVTLYADKNRLAELVLDCRLKKDPRGNVEILERFWPPVDGFGAGDTVHPILIYADLVAISDQRTMETARMIHADFIDRHFGQD
ncbi:type IV toxin-antitoxin system AbiEi family antitoxin [Desulfoprunum benzoelyticum]|uniref:Uncharacterized protein n=1 Tax=Desulfoprunum benzoelyticum TaxID=1506996 RepID=A0A840USH6_9BACT|nr:type IV toxin-antitoxin system AbiEi family antitoxin [Desulfoprunum benzoelyticum]MBB5347673.1 hypothetical protein [Desulfoprunum benzoelyticum]MBM9531890.1 type IV toxin-antitoxin system AbiEi family antitoxin [Desulfoprunum benzoelyticum]